MKKYFLICLIYIFTIVPFAKADFVLYQEGDWWDVAVSGEWNSATLSYSVFNDSDTGLWKYEYDFDASSRKNISHIITEVSESFEEDNIFDGTTGGYDLDDYNDQDQGNSNPGLPYEIKGLKWNPGIESDQWSWIIVSDRSPMDGLIYAVDGKNPNEDVPWAYGTALVPDTTSTPVPEPASMILLGSGLIGLAGYTRKKFKKK